MKKITTLFCLCALAACSNQTNQDIKDLIGLGRHSPDEFMIVTNQPLEMPTDFSKLPEPSDEAKITATNRVSAQTMAKEALVGKEQTVSVRDEMAKQKSVASSLSEAEKSFLAKIGESDEAIRKTVDKEAEKTSKSRLLGSSDMVIDATKEAERIKEIQDEGGAVTGEGTPIRKR